MNIESDIIEIMGTPEPSYLVVPQGEPEQIAEELRNHPDRALTVPSAAVALFRLLRRQSDESDAQLSQMISSMLSERPPVASDAAVRQSRRNAEARWEFLKTHGALTSGDVADLAGSKARNRSATAHNWQSKGAIFAVDYQHEVYFPSFQFGENGKPKRVIGEVLPLLRTAGLRGWEVALWFTAPNGWLDGAQPLDLLDAAPEEERLRSAAANVGAVVG